MSERTVVADSGPLISLARIGQLKLLRLLFQKISIPTAVLREVTQGAAEGRAGAAEVCHADWIETIEFDPKLTAGFEIIVDAGEAAAIALAKERNGLLLIDDDRGRRLALRLGLSIKGTLGVLVIAKRGGHVAEVRPLLEQLIEQGIHISSKLVAATLQHVQA